MDTETAPVCCLMNCIALIAIPMSSWQIPLSNDDPLRAAPAVVWGGAGDCRYFLDNERFILAETGGEVKKKLFVWDRWQRSTHVIGDYAATAGTASGFSQAGLRPMWDRTGARVAFDSTHGGQGWQVHYFSNLKVPRHVY